MSQSPKRKTKMKIELDMVSGLVVVADFDSNVEVVTGSLKLRDFLKDETVGVLGFEVSEREAQEIIDLGYAIKGFCV